MYIKSVIIDGFKSYGKRTEVNGFDPKFNAITGLNGTGKSNILDSICFVLGITNLGHVRAATLQDLIYKSGRAGITKASVTLVFDNNDPDPDKSPIGMRHLKEITITRQIMMGGKNKYLINGKNVLNKKVHDLFCSVQLNVNNPNFLIMQGRITKVLNMKPPEILSMIEEAAGTSMYEEKRAAATKMIEKKQAKYAEISAVLVEEITPRLVKLRKEREYYLEYKKICNEVEFLTRLSVSYTYLQVMEVIKESEKNVNGIQTEIDAKNARITDNMKEFEEIGLSIQELQEKIDSESDGTLKEIESQLTAANQQDVKVTANLKSMKDTIGGEERKIKGLQKSIVDDKKFLMNKESEMQKVQGLFQNLKDTDAADSIASADAQKRFEAISVGLSTNEDGEAASLEDQLINAQSQLSEATTKIKESEMVMRDSEIQLKQKKAEMNFNDGNYKEEKSQSDRMEIEMRTLEKNLSKMDYQDGLLEELTERKMALTQECRNYKMDLNRRDAHRYELQYRDPEPGFDRRRVKGMVCKLITVKDKKNALALSIAAGGSLWSVIVDTDVTSKKILDKGQLQTRTTMIPLNKISNNALDPNTIKLAQDLVGAENCVPALSLIEYDRELEPAMRFIFGRTFICKDMNVAKQVTYHRSIMTRSVTLEGDIMSPDGSLSGGSRPKGGALLLDIAEINEIQKLYNTKENELHALQTDIANLQNVAQTYNHDKEQLELLHHKFKALQIRLAQTTFQQTQKEIEDLTAKLETLRTIMNESRAKQKHCTEKIKEVKFKISDSKGHRERELKAAEAEMKRLKKKSEESRKNWKKHEQEFETLRLEIVELKQSIEQSEKQVEELNTKIEEMQINLKDATENNSSLSKQISELKAQLQEQKNKINSQNKELKTRHIRREKITKLNEDLNLEIKVLENKIGKTEAANSDAVNKIKQLENQHLWIVEDKEYFGAKNTRYDYTKENPVDAGKKLKLVVEQKGKMERNVNEKAMMLLEREEEMFNDAAKRKQMIEKDKDMIKLIIKDLDDTKTKVLKKAWKDVDKNFGEIFTSILPGTQAKLIAQEGKDFMAGLEFKIGFNGVWKESLTELSGGQRSLVALSLILAMLKFKPAPLYILDEVDAALDLSHTQNIGNMLKTHFTDSQFIIVSLKDGMFNNANVLFRTRFIDGMSAVVRTVNSSNIRV